MRPPRPLFVALTAVSACAPGAIYFPPPGPSVPAPAPAVQTSAATPLLGPNGAPLPVDWYWEFDAAANRLTFHFQNHAAHPVAFSYRVTERVDLEGRCTSGPFDFNLPGATEIPVGHIAHAWIDSGLPPYLYVCITDYRALNGSWANEPQRVETPASQPVAAPSYESLCYDLDCNGHRTGKQCFNSRAEYCASLCASDNCLAPDACRRNCG
jgi:hypothetical protein